MHARTWGCKTVHDMTCEEKNTGTKTKWSIVQSCCATRILSFWLQEWDQKQLDKGVVKLLVYDNIFVSSRPLICLLRLRMLGYVHLSRDVSQHDSCTGSRQVAATVIVLFVSCDFPSSWSGKSLFAEKMQRSKRRVLKRKYMPILLGCSRNKTSGVDGAALMTASGVHVSYGIGCALIQLTWINVPKKGWRRRPDSVKYSRKDTWKLYILPGYRLKQI